MSITARFRTVLTLGTLLVAAVSASASLPSVALDSLSGTVEIQRAGQKGWKLAKTGSRLFNNDIIRVLASSKARLVWEDGSVMYVHANSHILINLFNSPEGERISHHTTVFFGAVFFLIKHSLPKALTSHSHHKVYTPTAALAIRGTSFEVAVDKVQGDTRVKVVNGTVRIANILKKEAVILSAGYQSLVTMNADPLSPTALLEKDLSDLKSWIPASLIDQEMSSQIMASKRDHYVITGKLENKLIIVPFANTSTYQGSWDLSRHLSNDLGRRIGTALGFLDVMVAPSPESDGRALAQKEHARYIVRGEVGNFDVVQRAEILAKAGTVKESISARVKLHLEIIDLTRQAVLFEDDIIGEMTGSGASGESFQELTKLPVHLTDERFTRTILGRAVHQALEQSAIVIEQYLRP